MSDTVNPFLPKPIQIRPPAPGESLLFLDFDGVVHPRPEAGIPTSWAEVLALKGDRFFLPEPMAQVLRLCRALDAVIVLTTSWRNKGFALHDFNPLFDGRIIGQTPEVFGRLYDRGLREKEVVSYLAEFAPDARHVIVDDKPENFSDELANLYLTEPTAGLTDALVDRILADMG